MSGRGFSKSRLDRMHKVLAGHVEFGAPPGLVSLVSRHGEVHVDVIGSLEMDGAEPMKRDTIFRIASLTKPITAVAVMIMIEECWLRLDEPVDELIPELANRKVLKDIGSPITDTIPANRPITVRDTLNFCLGFGSVMAMPDTYPIQASIRDLKIGGDGPPLPADAPSTQEWIEGLGSLPLMYQPGEKWLYNTGADVQGILVERFTGMSLEAFMKERIFDPLGMKDTSFSVPPEKMDRLPAVYRTSSTTGGLEVYDGIQGSQWSTPPPFQSGAGGLVSTADDYHAFCQMMLGKGKYKNERILSRPSVELMTSDQLTPAQRAEASVFFGNASSWGLGVSVDIHRDNLYINPGRFGWTGGLGTTAYSDPQENLVGILMTQRMMDSPEPPAVFLDYWTSVYQAIED